MRRKKYTIDISNLNSCKELKRELERIYPDCKLDISTFKLSAYETYIPTVKVDLEALISRINSYIYINGDKIVTKRELVKIARISRPTIDRLCDLGVLTNHHTHYAFSKTPLSEILTIVKNYIEKTKKA